MDQNFWFSMTNHKFLHNIDTFYFSVKLEEDFTKQSTHEFVRAFREYIKRFDNVDNLVPFSGLAVRDPLNYVPMCYDKFYTFHLEAFQLYDIFFAPVVPEYQGGGSVTPEILVQIRSKLLWEIGCVAAFERAFSAVQALCKFFNFHILDVKENRTDFCWHTNHLKNPEVYFNPEHLKQMVVTRLGHDKASKGNAALLRVVFHGDDPLEYDYVAYGKRSDKCFLRIYLKTKEVVQQGYKPWFLPYWLFQGMISRYDYYVFDLAMKEKNWAYCDIARLKFALENMDLTPSQVDDINSLLAFEFADKDSKNKPNYPAIKKLADQLTPALTKVYNIEFQVMRRMSKTFVLAPYKDNSSKGVCQRVYDYFDNRADISEYLTHETFRLIDRDSDSNRSRCCYTDFWRRLRGTKFVDVCDKHHIKLMRDYSKRFDVEIRKVRAARAIASFGSLTNPSYDLFTDSYELLSSLNDNDLYYLAQYKLRCISRFGSQEVDFDNDNSPGS